MLAFVPKNHLATNKTCVALILAGILFVRRRRN